MHYALKWHIYYEKGMNFYELSSSAMFPIAKQKSRDEGGFSSLGG